MLTTAMSTERTASRPAVTARPAARPHSGALDECFARAPARQLRAKEPLFAEGDPKSNIYKVETGAVLIFKILNDGYRQIVNFAFPGDYIGLEMCPEHLYDAQTIAPTRVRSIPAATLMRHVREDVAVASDLYNTLSKDIARANMHLLTIGRLSATGRIASFLLALSERRAEKGLDPVNIQLPVRRSDMADFLCVSVETVSRSLTELKQTRTISLSGWRQIKLIDRETLAELATGEYH
jgi:CRP/FNR family transcriptional regulator